MLSKSRSWNRSTPLSNTKGTESPGEGKYRGWLIVINNVTTTEEATFRMYCCLKKVYQIEKGKDGTIHLQGWLYHENNVFVANIKKIFPRAHIEVCKSNRAVELYSQKTETRLRGPYWSGDEPVGQGHRSDLDQAAVMFLENQDRFIDEYPGKFVQYYKGFQKLKELKYKEKTRKPLVKWIVCDDDEKALEYIHSFGADCYIKDDSKWWAGYKQQAYCIFLDYKLINKRVFDKYPYQVPVFGSMIGFNSYVIWIINNKPIKYCEDMNFVCYDWTELHSKDFESHDETL
jgi:hypothetical protein